ncbi:MAG: hypothetical protein LBC45_04715 [Chlamydiales bacterium]|jgi:hypothetical protein|nr:hypothetical protein [Chlamydiales bacterium]
MIHFQLINYPGRETKLTSFFPSPTQFMRNVNRIALPAIALFATSAVQTADSGPIAWAVCIAACEAVAISATAATSGAAAASLIACVKACGAILPLPFPP